MVLLMGGISLKPLGIPLQLYMKRVRILGVFENSTRCLCVFRSLNTFKNLPQGPLQVTSAASYVLWNRQRERDKYCYVLVRAVANIQRPMYSFPSYMEKLMTVRYFFDAKLFIFKNIHVLFP